MAKEAVHAQEVTPVGPAIIPERPPAELLETAECAKILKEAILPHLKSKADLATFRARPGVTLTADREGDPVIEVFLRDRVKGVTCRRISQVVKLGTMEIYVRGLLEDLQEKHFWEQPIVYRRIEVLREILYELGDLLPEGNPEVPEFQEGTAPYYRLKIDRIRKRIQDLIEETQG